MPTSTRAGRIDHSVAFLNHIHFPLLLIALPRRISVASASPHLQCPTAARFLTALTASIPLGALRTLGASLHNLQALPALQNCRTFLLHYSSPHGPS